MPSDTSRATAARASTSGSPGTGGASAPGSRGMFGRAEPSGPPRRIQPARVGRALADDDDHFAARVDLARGRGRGERAQASAERLLVELRQLATDGRRPRGAAGRGELRQGRRQPARRLEQHRRALVRAKAFEPLATLPPAARQEALEAPPRARDAARRRAPPGPRTHPGPARRCRPPPPRPRRARRRGRRRAACPRPSRAPGRARPGGAPAAPRAVACSLRAW